jgi:hypothetical protein
MLHSALIRYKTIDACLSNRSRKWTLADLMEACGQALHAAGDRDNKPISRRALQMDLELMRSAEQGYNAPIVVVDKKYYTYAQPEFSILKHPLSVHDRREIEQMADFLAHFETYAHFEEARQWAQQLRDKARGINTPLPTTASAPGFTLTENGPKTTVEFYVDAPLVEHYQQHPLHPSQKVVSVRIDQRHLFAIEVVVDAELEKLLLAQGEYLEIVSPKPLRLKIGTRIWKAGRHY